MADAELCDTRAARRWVSPSLPAHRPTGCLPWPHLLRKGAVLSSHAMPRAGGVAGALQASSQILGEIPGGTCPEARAGGPQAHCPVLRTPGRSSEKGLAGEGWRQQRRLSWDQFPCREGEAADRAGGHLLSGVSLPLTQFPFTPQHASLSSARLL